MVLKLYVCHLSQPARALMMFVRANNIPAEIVTIQILNKEHQTEEFAKINRFQKLPAIVHDDFHLSECIAIFRYLIKEFKVADHWYPQSSREGARVDEFLSWHHIGLRNPICRLIFADLIPYKRTTPEATLPADQLRAGCRKDLADCIDLFEKLWLDGTSTPFVAGDEVTVADLMAVAELEITRLIGYDVREGRPKVAAYLDRVKGAVGQELYDDVHAMLYETQKVLESQK